MISPARSAHPAAHSRPPGAASSPADAAGEPAYGRPFWFAYVANTLTMMAVALLFRYADFVLLLGGTEFHLGWIVGVGMIGSLTMRLVIGTGIDRHGPRLIWLGSLVILAICCAAHLAVARYDSMPIYLLRIVYCSAIAGVFGSSMTFISGRVSLARMAEMIGMLGTSGFIGMAVGTQLGDLLCGTEQIGRGQIDRMFLVAAALASVAVLFAALATRGHRKPVPVNRLRLVPALRRYHPGMTLLVGVATGVGLGIPAVFLRAYAANLSIPRIGLFFLVYSPTAICTRLLTRRLPERLGLTPMILVGLSGLAGSMALMLVVGAEWQLVAPGIGFGFSHAILFPSVVAAGSRAFPHEHRGLGTTVALASFDAGQLVGAPTVGAILHVSGGAGLPPYPTMFVTVAGMLLAVATVYGLSRRRAGQRQACREWTPPAQSDAPVAEPSAIAPLAPTAMAQGTACREAEGSQ